jgi:hypothetical protein
MSPHSPCPRPFNHLLSHSTTGACMEILLKNGTVPTAFRISLPLLTAVLPDILGTLVRLSETDRPFGIQAEVLRAVQNMVVLLNEQFLVHAPVHKAVLRLLRGCVGDDLQEQFDGRSKKVMGAAGAVARSPPSEYEEDRACRILFFSLYETN